eukprot:279442_1
MLSLRCRKLHLIYFKKFSRPYTLPAVSEVRNSTKTVPPTIKSSGRTYKIQTTRKNLSRLSLKDSHPKLAVEFDSEHNWPLTASQYVSHQKRIWWRCVANPEHRWEATAAIRINDRLKCPHCWAENRKFCIRKSYRNEFHPTLNSPTTVDGPFWYAQRIWWQCTRDHAHIWQCTHNARIRTGQGCPVCPPTTSYLRSILDLDPSVAAEFHPTKNHPLRASSRIRKSERVWWKCLADGRHVWEATVTNRVHKKRRCPFCSINQRAPRSMPLTETHPQLVKEWHPTRNLPLEPSQQLARWKRVVWQCSVTKDHVWEMKIYFRTYHKSGCPHCLRIRKTKPIILAKQSPVFTDEWHPTLNGSLKPTDSLKQEQVVHWQCRTHPDHTWSTQVLARVHFDAGCPHCRRTFSNRRSIARLIPSVAAEWHPTKNGTLSPEKVQYKSRADIWWVCSKCSFEWKASPFYRCGRLDVCPNCNPIPLSQPLS